MVLKSDGKIKQCPSCKGPLGKRPNSFYFRGRYYAMDFCPACNSTWGIPDEFTADVAAGVFRGTDPGDIVPDISKGS